MAAAGSTEWIRDIRVIQYIKELGAELSRQPFFIFERLRHRKIPVVVRHASEWPGAKIAITSKCRRDEHGVTVNVAPATILLCQRCHSQRSKSLRLCQAG